MASDDPKALGRHHFEEFVNRKNRRGRGRREIGARGGMKHWSETRAVMDRLAALERAGLRAALATVVRVRGSAYRHEGAKLLVAEDGSMTGNVSGGCLEQDVREVALGVIRSGRAELRSYCSGSDEGAPWDLGVGCEGHVDVYIEPVSRGRRKIRSLLDGRTAFAACTLLETAGGGSRLLVWGDRVEGRLGLLGLDERALVAAREALAAGRSAVHELGGHQVFIDAFLPPPQLVVFGGGEDARPLARFAVDAGFQVTVVDHRPAYLAPDRFPVQVRRVECRPEHLSQVLRLDERGYAVVMNHHFAHDQAVVS